MERKLGRKGELLQLGAGELVTLLPLLILEPSTESTAALALADLLQPETSRRRIEHPQQLQVLILPGPLGQLDHGGGTVEHLSAPVQYEVVVRRHERER